MKLSENIRALRKEKGLTQEQLAEALGVSVGAVSKWESAQTEPAISMLPSLADFFGVSLDVLMGFTLCNISAESAAEQIRECRVNKDYARGAEIAENALRRYPNHFNLVYTSAELYKLKGLEQKSESDHRRALELLERAEQLFSQNQNPEISLFGIRRKMAEVYPFLHQPEKALAILKRDNLEGVYNCEIGMLLAENFSDVREAQLYLSNSYISCISELFRDVIGFVNCYVNTGDYAKAEALLRWYHGVIAPLTPKGAVTAFLKYEVWTLASAAVVAALQGKQAAAADLLANAYDAALRFDAVPDYSYHAVPFYAGPETARFYDNIGNTAMESVLSILQQNKELKEI